MEYLELYNLEQSIGNLRFEQPDDWPVSGYRDEQGCLALFQLLQILVINDRAALEHTLT